MPAIFRDAPWGALIAGAETFQRDWGLEAAQLSWTTSELFAVDRRAPYARLDHMGLVVLLNGRTIAAMTAETAALLTPHGSTQTYRRRAFDPAQICLVCELGT